MTIIFSLGVLHRGFPTAFIFAHCFLRVRPKMCATWQSLHFQLHTRVPCPSSRALGLGLDGDLNYLFAFSYHYPLVEQKAIELQFRVIEKITEERLLLVIERLISNFVSIFCNSIWCRERNDEGYVHFDFISATGHSFGCLLLELPSPCTVPFSK